MLIFLFLVELFQAVCGCRVLIPWGKNDMKCNPELVSAFLDGELDEILVKPLVDHLVDCENCKQLLSKLASARDAMAESFHFPDPESMTSRIMGALEETVMAPSRGGFQSQLLRYGAPAAVAAAALAGAVQLGATADEASSLFASDTTARIGRDLIRPPSTPQP